MPTIASHTWIPSVARTVTLDDFVPVPRGASPVAPTIPSWPLKDPGDTLDYQFNIAPALIGNDGDAISTLDITIVPAAAADLTLTATAADGARAVLWFSRGQAGTTYTITLTIGTQNGRTIARSVLLPVAALATPVILAESLLASDGTPLVDQNGNPILATP
jgi:fermentation-respiration switch protein FrsA (DUF1100 family)